MSTTAATAEGESSSTWAARPKSAMQDTLRGVFALVDQAFISLTTFGTMVLVAKLGERPDFNLFVLAFSVLSFFRVALERSLAAPFMVFANQPKRHQASYLGSSLVHLAVIAALSCLAILVAAFASEQFSSLPGIGFCLAICGCIAPTVLLRDFLRVVSTSNFRFGSAVLLSGLAFAFQLGGILLCHYFQQLDERSVLLVIGFANLVPCLIWFWLYPIAIEFHAARIWSDWKEVFAYSRWLLLARCFPSATSSLLPWIVLWQLGENASGAFAACLSLANISMMFVYGIISFFQPRAVRALHQEGRYGLQRWLLIAAGLFTTVLSSLCLGFYFFGDVALSLIFAESFTEYGHLVALLSLNVLIVSYSIVAGMGIAALEQPKGIFWGEVMYSVVALAVAILATPWLGLAGTGLALCLGSLIATLISIGVLLHLLRSQHQNLLTRGNNLAEEATP